MKNFKTYSEFINENYDTEQRKKMAEKGFALADGSFPIANLEDLKNGSAKAAVLAKGVDWRKFVCRDTKRRAQLCNPKFR